MKIKKSKKNNKSKKIGGELKRNCTADPSQFPKCGKEGCVYLNNDNVVTKKQWKTSQQIPHHLLSIEGQTNSKQLSPDIISQPIIKPCDLISKIGSENKAPCFVKRFRRTKNGEKILYEEENRESWCRNYGINNQCVVDEIMYNKFKNEVPKISYNGKPDRRITLPDSDSQLDGDSNAVDDEELGNMYDNVLTDKSFTDLNPVYMTDITMNRIKGITIAELISEMIAILGQELTFSVAGVWEAERNTLISKVASLGYTSNDFHEGNIMIDVDNESLCLWIDDILARGIPITPQMIKEAFGKENILKIVDWGLLTRTR